MPLNPFPETVTRKGDIWLLGKHKLICCDSGDVSSIAKLMENGKAGFCFTSPPYARQRDYMQPIADWTGMMTNVFQAAPFNTDTQILVNLGLNIIKGRVNRYWDKWIGNMESLGWNLFDWYVWDKMTPLPGAFRGHLTPRHEFIFHFNKKTRQCHKTFPNKNVGKVKSGHGLRTRNGMSREMRSNKPIHEKLVADSVIWIPKQNGRIGKGIDHPAVFPIALPEFIFQIWTEPGDLVFEPFCGSGTSIIAGEKTGRIIRAAEIAPEYVDVALIRFSRMFPDVKIIHAASGKTYAETAGERLCS